MLEQVVKMIREHSRSHGRSPTRILLNQDQLEKFLNELRAMSVNMVPLHVTQPGMSKRKFMGVDIRSVDEV
jgi:hypothetical protein